MMNFFKDVEDRNPILAGGFQTDFGTVVFSKPVSQFFESFGEGREAGLLILSKSIHVGNADAGIDPGFVDIKTTTDFTKEFKHIVHPVKRIAGLAGTGRPAKSSQLRKR